MQSGLWWSMSRWLPFMPRMASSRVWPTTAKTSRSDDHRVGPMKSRVRGSGSPSLRLSWQVANVLSTPNDRLLTDAMKCGPPMSMRVSNRRSSDGASWTITTPSSL